MLENELLTATDHAAMQRRVNRSAFVREALREHLRRVALREREKRDRDGYERNSESQDEFSAWDEVAAWPDE